MSSRLILIFILSASQAGCALSERLRLVAHEFTQAQTQVQGQHTAFASVLEDTELRQKAQDVAKPWLAGKAEPLARELSLPLALRAQIRTTLLFADQSGDLRQIARRISAATGIPVTVRPDALLPAWHFLPRLAGMAVQGAQESSLDEPFVLADERQPLVSILDRLSAHMGVLWRFEHGRIEFFRTQTRVFSVRALALDARADASLGQGRGQSNDGFVSASNTHFSSGEQDVMKTIRARIEPFLSRAGLLVAESGASSTIVVTDTPDVLDRIAQYIEYENRAMTRRVRLIFEEITVAINDHAEAGLDWNLVFSSAKIAATLAMPGAEAGRVAGSLGIGVSQGPFAGSDAVVRALGEVGQLLRRSSVPMLTLNRRPVTHAVRTTFSYIDRVETTSVSGAAGLTLPTISVSQKEETVGSLLTVVPDAQEDGQILLSIAYDNTVAQPLKSVTFGDKANPLQLQQLTIDGNGTVQQLAVQPGQPLVVSGFDRHQEESTERRLNPGVPAIFGGSNQVSSQRLTTVLVITAQIEEGF
ncbi:hypothetical protein KVP09_01435 [Alcaligenaceae bacterium CGII-47]|nr:hypothetical protein [Alcaligenaceae bacterium CGII-47]